MDDGTFHIFHRLSSVSWLRASAPHPQRNAADKVRLILSVLRPLSSAFSLLQLTLQDLDFSRERGIGPDQAFDLADCMKNRGVVTPAEPTADFGQ
jgi:hypothetical protein